MNPRTLILFLLGCMFLVSCKSPEARKPVQQSSGSFFKESAKRNKVLYKKEEARIVSMMDENPDNNYISSDRGFWYYYNVKDSLDIPTPEIGDIVTFTYDIRSLDGASILTESEAGLQVYKIDQSNQDLISGLRDGVKLMKVGEQVTFLFPSYKAYGYYGLEDKLGTNVPIQSTVTLKSIQQSQ